MGVVNIWLRRGYAILESGQVVNDDGRDDMLEE